MVSMKRIASICIGQLYSAQQLPKSFSNWHTADLACCNAKEVGAYKTLLTHYC